MGFGGGTINSWDQIKQNFLTKYQDYCRSKYLREEIFKMTSKQDETLEEYIEYFNTIYKYHHIPLYLGMR